MLFLLNVIWEAYKAMRFTHSSTLYFIIVVMKDILYCRMKKLGFKEESPVWSASVMSLC